MLFVRILFNVHFWIHLFVTGLEILKGKFKFRGPQLGDTWIDVAAVVNLGIGLPVYSFLFGKAFEQVWPAGSNCLVDLSVWAQLGLIVLGDDLVHYFWHRACHAFPVLWPFHRPHHSANYMGTRVIYRDGFFHFWVTPNFWATAFLCYVGFLKVYFLYALVKLLISEGAHSELRWERRIYEIRWLRPVTWLMERTIVTSATHFAHHASRGGDGVGQPNGNFGGVLFIWDVLFGTGLISRRYPEKFGLSEEEEKRRGPWWFESSYPFSLMLPRRAMSPERGASTV